jgi:hypothetical protein
MEMDTNILEKHALSIFRVEELFWIVTRIVLEVDTKVSEEHATPVFTVEVVL